MGTHPAYRRRGAASTLMEWGETRAAVLNLGVFIESSGEARSFYKSYGYRVLLDTSLSAEKEDANDEWKKLAHDLLPQPVSIMWKPAKNSDDNIAMPWDLEVEKK